MMGRSREPHGWTTSILTGLLVFGILMSRSLWYQSSEHIPYWLIGLIGGGSSMAARRLVKLAMQNRV